MPTEKTLAKQKKRAEKEAKLASTIMALPAKKYAVIYADPPWRFQPRSRDTGLDKSADNHYPTLQDDIICGFPVETFCYGDAVLFLWATVPALPAALRVMKAWSFEYKSHFIWAKPRIGTGFWNRNKHELLLVGTRGDLPAPAMGKQMASLIQAPVGAHSEKPEIFYELIEAYFPNLPKIELFARKRRDGWDSWGNEVPALG